jgi:hypothetical protein
MSPAARRLHSLAATLAVLPSMSLTRQLHSADFGGQRQPLQQKRNIEEDGQ